MARSGVSPGCVLLTRTPCCHNGRVAIKGISLKVSWRCPHCRVHVDTFVTLPEPPTHKCPRKANKVIRLEREEDK